MGMHAYFGNGAHDQLENATVLVRYSMQPGTLGFKMSRQVATTSNRAKGAPRGAVG
jgi:hypothetical protein